MKLERFVRKAVRLALASGLVVLPAALAGCSMMGKSSPRSTLVTLTMMTTGNVNNCARTVALPLQYKMIQVTDPLPLAGMKLDRLWGHESEMLGGALVWTGPELTIEPGAKRAEAPVPADPRARAVVVIANFCKTRESCFYHVQSLPEPFSKQSKQGVLLNLTADSTCIGPTPH